MLTQLPEVAGAAVSGPFVVNFLEQGIERKLHFMPDRGEFTVQCTTHLKTWTPPAGIVKISKETARQTFVRLVEDFDRLAREICRPIADHPWFEEWRRASLAAWR